MAAVQPQDENSSEDGMRAHSTDAMVSLNTEGGSANVFQSSSRSALSTEEQKKLFESVIEHLKIKSVDEDSVMAQNDDVEMEFDLEDQRAKIETLREVFQSVSQLWWSGSQQMDLVVENLADKSRDPRWRIPLGDSGMLDFFLQVLNTNPPSHSLQIHMLRLIGNSCADTDENRARVISSGSLRPIIHLLEDTSLLPFTIPVLYNICVDYEPAQQQASDLFLSKELVQLISSPSFNDSRSFLNYICQILDLLATRPSELEVAPENIAVVLLMLAIDREFPCDSEDYLALVNTAIAYMKHEKFQKALITLGGLDTTLTVLIESYTRFDAQVTLGSAQPDEEDAKLLSQMRTNFNQVLSDVSALPEFKEACPVVSPFTSSLRRWLSSPQLQLQVCACIMLGNLARSDEACVEFVHTSQVHKPLIAILKDANDSQLLHAALGFLKNLALPDKNKDEIGNAGIIPILPRLWHLDTLQDIQFSSISLARQLIINSFMNVRRICKRLSDDEDSPANSRTYLSFLIGLFERTDVEPIKMEISRLVTALCRVFETYKGKELSNLASVRARFFSMHPDIGRPLSFMVSQNKWPVVRSEGWFVFALMARYPEGAQCISDLLNDVAVFQPLMELLTGKDLIDPKSSTLQPTPASPASLAIEGLTPGQSSDTPQPHSQAAQMARLDRENALVLVSEMLKNRGSDMAVMRRAMFEDLLKGGGEIVLAAKEGGTVAPRTSRGADEILRELMG
ncbi:ARM repeat-containing protein [Glarea lozoyensis ATCC 20868]|uniref:ARM repeat-containing protein n=1 Tax=Glarea lozoyensis (strain ATCC 20868 / MF5171) TaxID=1116229 RepID=S3CZC9_GLAL2|nr:ARM repeat-containing protein [Glarea lozoyensis ATCC 20868]EPE31627.1 ARM repeat-containing protein [Glarea lozoyensis ATCC 20868]